MVSHSRNNGVARFEVHGHMPDWMMYGARITIEWLEIVCSDASDVANSVNTFRGIRVLEE